VVETVAETAKSLSTYLEAKMERMRTEPPPDHRELLAMIVHNQRAIMELLDRLSSEHPPKKARKTEESQSAHHTSP
jgi:hypothetical protein